jgi:hypothetical protein
LPPDDFTSLSVARKADGRDYAPKASKTKPADAPAPAGTDLKMEFSNKTRSTQLLSGEGEVGTDKALSDSRNKGDNIEVWKKEGRWNMYED